MSDTPAAHVSNQTRAIMVEKCRIRSSRCAQRVAFDACCAICPCEVLGSFILSRPAVLPPLFWQILGVHVVGENATEIVHVGQLAMDMGLTIHYFTETVFNYPTFAEAYRSAAFNGIKRLGLYKAGDRTSPPAIEGDADAPLVQGAV